MSIEHVIKDDWLYIPAPGRLDAFNFQVATREFSEMAGRKNQIAIDVSNANFISIQMIKFIHELAKDLLKQGGRLALVGPTEKLIRQFNIFASLEPFTIFTQDGWEKMVNTSAHGNA